MSLFDLMIPLSFEYLRRKTQKESLTTLQDINSEGVFTYTIYSQNAKKKYLKFLNKFRQEKSHPLLFNQSNHLNQPDSDSIIKGVELFYKFLKGLTSRVRRVAIKMDRKNIEELINREIKEEYPFVINKKHPLIENILQDKDNNANEIVLNVALLETRVAKHIQKFDYLYMKFDPKIKNQEEKIQNKLRKKIKKEENVVFPKQNIFLDLELKREIENENKNEGYQSFDDF